MGQSVDSRVYRFEALEEGEGQKYRFSKNRKANGGQRNRPASWSQREMTPGGWSPEGLCKRRYLGKTSQNQWVQEFPSSVELLERGESSGHAQPDGALGGAQIR